MGSDLETARDSAPLLSEYDTLSLVELSYPPSPPQNRAFTTLSRFPKRLNRLSLCVVLVFSAGLCWGFYLLIHPVRLAFDERIPGIVKTEEATEPLNIPDVNEPWSRFSDDRAAEIKAWLENARSLETQSTTTRKSYANRFPIPDLKWSESASKWLIRLQSIQVPTLNGPRFNTSDGKPLFVDRKDMYIPRELMGTDGETIIKREKNRDMDNKRVQKRVEGDENVEVNEKRREWVRKLFLHTWNGYKANAWGQDEIRPISKSASNNYNGWGATLFDSLDVLLMLGLDDEYNLARQHVASVDFTNMVPPGADWNSSWFQRNYTESDFWWNGFEDGDPKQDGFGPYESDPVLAINVARKYKTPKEIRSFETIIRYLGGLISAYELSNDFLMLDRARELGDWLLPALSTSSGLLDPRYTIGENPNAAKLGLVSLAEVGSLGLEFGRLSMLTGDPLYFNMAQRGMGILDTGYARKGRLGSLFPLMIPTEPPRNSFYGAFAFGGMADSFYEYLIKQYQLFGLNQFERMYEEAIESAYKFLIRPVNPAGKDQLVIIGQSSAGKYTYKMEHLTCFAGGMFGLGSKLLSRPKDLSTGQELTNTCFWMYNSSMSGLGPEWITFYSDKEWDALEVARKEHEQQEKIVGGGFMGYSRPDLNFPPRIRQEDSKYIGRPETIESIFYMYRITGEKKYQEMGWEMFVNWVGHAMLENGIASIANVNKPQPDIFDYQESFVLAETIKYYYLLFSPMEFFSLDDWVFNTEAHPFRVPNAQHSRPGSYQPTWTPNNDDDNKSTAEDDMDIGRGSHIQQWYRVQQAAELAKYGKNGSIE